MAAPVHPLADDRWRGVRLAAPDRLFVLLACCDADAADIRVAWAGQPVDVDVAADLGAALYLAGRYAPDLVVVCPCHGPAEVTEFLRTLQRMDRQTPIVVGDSASSGPAPSGSPHPSGIPSAFPVQGSVYYVPTPFVSDDLLPLLTAAGVNHPSFGLRPVPIDIGRLRVDGSMPRMWLDGVEATLPPMEFILLRYLAERATQLLSRHELVTAAWGQGATVSSNSLSVHLGRLRRRLQRLTGTDWIRPVRGFGYQFLPPDGQNLGNR